MPINIFIPTFSLIKNAILYLFERFHTCTSLMHEVYVWQNIALINFEYSLSKTRFFILNFLKFYFFKDNNNNNKS